MSKILLIIAPKGYQDIEYSETKEKLEDAGHDIDTASTVQEAQGSLGGSTQVNLLLENIDPELYKAVAFIGGPGCFDYFTNETALTIAKKFHETGKITAAICAAPGILANAGILQDKTVTSHESVAETVKNKGADYTGMPVEQDENIITANGPTAATAFGQKINEALNK